MKVRISGDAFAVILASGIEVYKREVLGFLIGEVKGNNIAIHNAVPAQSVERKFTEVVPNERTHRFKDTLAELCTNGTKVVGDYHTHPLWGNRRYSASPSKFDLKGMRDEGGLVYLIISMRNKARNQPWYYRGDGRLVGSFNDYWFEFAAYYQNGNSQFNLAQIVCPSAIKRKNK